MYDSKEGHGDDDPRTKELRDYVAQHVRVLEDLRAKVERSPRSKAAWKKCNKRGSSRNRMLLERDAAVVQELSSHDQEGADVARAPEAPNRLERSTPVVLYPKQCAADVARIQKELDAEDHGVPKPSEAKSWSRHVPTPLNVVTWKRWHQFTLLSPNANQLAELPVIGRRHERLL